MMETNIQKEKYLRKNNNNNNKNTYHRDSETTITQMLM